METRLPLVQRLLSTALHLRYKWFGKGPSLDQWEERPQRVVAETDEQSLPYLPRQGARLLDIGANVGIYTEKILAARPDCQAWLFEPVRAHYERCVTRFAGKPKSLPLQKWEARQRAGEHDPMRIADSVANDDRIADEQATGMLALRTLASVAQSLASLEGRKAVLYVSRAYAVECDLLKP